MLEAAISVSALQARHVRARFECPGTLPSHIEKLVKMYLLDKADPGTKYLLDKTNSGVRIGE